MKLSIAVLALAASCAYAGKPQLSVSCDDMFAVTTRTLLFLCWPWALVDNNDDDGNDDDDYELLSSTNTVVLKSLFYFVIILIRYPFVMETSTALTDWTPPFLGKEPPTVVMST